MSVDHVEGYISALKKQLGITRDDELSAKLGVAKSTVSSWRKRGQVPKAISKKAEAEFGVSYDRVFEAYAFTKQLRNSYVRQAYFMAICKLAKILDHDDLKMMVAWSANSEASICKVLGIGDSLANVSIGLAEAKALSDRADAPDSDLVDLLFKRWQEDQRNLMRVK